MNANRRTILKTLLSAIALTIPPATVSARQAGHFLSLGNSLEGVLTGGYVEALAKLGECYLGLASSDPALKNEAALVESLALSTAPGEPGVVEAVLEQHIKSDHNADRLVCLDGWWMSVTEARLCALTYFRVGRK
jgi:hypothetical protein